MWISFTSSSLKLALESFTTVFRSYLSLIADNKTQRPQYAVRTLLMSKPLFWNWKAKNSIFVQNATLAGQLPAIVMTLNKPKFSQNVICSSSFRLQALHTDTMGTNMLHTWGKLKTVFVNIACPFRSIWGCSIWFEAAACWGPLSHISMHNLSLKNHNRWEWKVTEPLPSKETMLQPRFK